MTDFERARTFELRIAERSAERIVPFAYGRAFLNDTLRRVWDLNVLRVEAATLPAAAVLTAEAERIQAAAGHAHRRLELGPRAGLDAAFAALGWAATHNLYMAHRRAPVREVEPGTAVEVEAEALAGAWERGIRSEPWGREDETVRQLLEHKRVTAEAVPTRYFAARVAREVASYCELYGDGETAQIEAVMTLEEHRRRGLGSAVVLRALAEARAQGAGLVFLVADADDWPKELYARLGFDAIGRTFAYLRPPP